MEREPISVIKHRPKDKSPVEFSIATAVLEREWCLSLERSEGVSLPAFIIAAGYPPTGIRIR